MSRAAARRFRVVVAKLGFISHLRQVSLVQITAVALIIALIVPTPVVAHALSDNGRAAVEIKNNMLLFAGTIWTRLLTGLGLKPQEASVAAPAVIDDMPGQQDPPRPERLPIIPTPSDAEREARVVRLETSVVENLTLRPQEHKQLTAVPRDYEGNAVHGFSPVWESSAPEIVSITPEGEVTAHALGAAILTARAGVQTAVATVSVVATPDPETVQTQAASTSATRHYKELRESRAQLRHATWSRDDGFWAEKAAGLKRRNAPAKFAKASMFLTDIPANEIASLFWPENEVGMPPGRTEPGAIVPPVAASGTEMPLSSNYFFSIPLVGRAGRGISANIALNYNSRVWHKSTDSTSGNTKMTYDIDTGWPSAGFRLGYGHLNWRPSGTTDGHILVDPNGTRHRLMPITSTTDDRDFETIDGTFTRFYDDVGDGGTVTYSNGTVIKFTTVGPDGLRLPTTITERNGNRLEFTYVGGVGPKIATIKDTLERYITFNYDSTTGELIAITVPSYNNGTTDTQVARFYYQTVTLNGTFQSPIIKSAPATARVLHAVYFPGTQSGYGFRYAAPYGVIDRVARRTEMAVSTTSLTANGTVTDYGDDAGVTTYNYLDAGSNLTDAPAYTKRYDHWAGRTASMGGGEPHHIFARITGTGTITSKITAPDGTVTKAVVRVAAGQWNDGLVEETRVEEGAGTIRSKNVTVWEHDGNSRNHRPDSTESTVDGKTRKAVMAYTSFNNVQSVKEYDFDLATELRRTEYTYETGTNYTNERLLHLPKSVRVYAGGALDTQPTAKTEYLYDETALTANSGMTMYSNPGTYRGNVTTVKRFAVPTSSTASDTDTIAYDNAGNVRTQSSACCQQQAMTYTSTNKFAYPEQVTKGASGGPQLTSSAAYDFNTGLVRTATDANNQVTEMQHEAATLRPTRIDRPDGGDTVITYGDAPVNDPALPHTFVKTETKIATGDSVINYIYRDGRGATARTFKDDVRGATSGSTNGFATTDVEYDVMGRVHRTSNPYFTDDTSTSINSANLWSKVTGRDVLGRTTLVELPDGNTVQTAYSGNAVTTTDQAGRQRRSITDALGRLARMDEPNAAGSLGTVSAPVQPTSYTYNALNKLTQSQQPSPQGTQTRTFKHDGLGRLTHEKQVEQKATLSDTGAHVGTGSWTKVIKYNALGLVSDVYDARGIRTQLTYDTLNRLLTKSYKDKNGAWEGTPTVNMVYDEAAANRYNNGRLTRVTTTDPANPLTIYTVESYKHNRMGQIVDHAQTVDAQTVNPITHNLGYGYNVAGQLTSETYPSGRIINYAYDEAGRTTGITGQYVGDVALPPMADAYVRDGSFAGDNFGSLPELISKTTTDVGYTRHSYLKFNLASVANITSAKLRLYGKLGDANATNLPTAVHAVSNTSWTEGGITWSNKPAGGATALATTTITDDTARWYEWDVTSYVQAEKAAARDIVSLLVKNPQNNNTAPVFNSKQASTKRPQLLITQSASTRTYTSQMKYTPHGGLESEALGNGTTYSVQYNSRLQPSNIMLYKGATELQRYGYDYRQYSGGNPDPMKNTGQVSRVESYIGGTTPQWNQRFSYDSVGRLDTASEYAGSAGTNPIFAMDYEHDRFGNRLQSANQNTLPGNKPVASSEIDAATNRFHTTYDGSGNLLSLKYDEAGNVTHDAKFRTQWYEYDANSRVKRAGPIGVQNVETTAVYSGTGQRLKTTLPNGNSRYMIRDIFGRIVDEYTGEGWDQANVYVGQNLVSMEEPHDAEYFMTDRQGSERVMTDVSGNIVARRDYQPYGEQIGAGVGSRTTGQGYGGPNNNRRRYAKKERDEGTDLEHTTWRKMDSWEGRWTSPDPYRGSMRKGDPQSLNRYSYTANDPVNRTDPSGLDYVSADNPYGISAGTFMNDNGYSTFVPYYAESVSVFSGPTGFVSGGHGSVGGTIAFGMNIYGPSMGFQGMAMTIPVQDPPPPPPPRDNCQRFANMVRDMANQAVASSNTDGVPGHALGRFLRGMANTFAGASNYDPVSMLTLSESGFTPLAIGNDGFRPEFDDGTGLQVRHYVGGLMSGYNLGSAILGNTIALAQMNARENSDVREDQIDMALNAVSTQHGSTLNANNFQQLADWIRRDVCMP